MLSNNRHAVTKLACAGILSAYSVPAVSSISEKKDAPLAQTLEQKNITKNKERLNRREQKEQLVRRLERQIYNPRDRLSMHERIEIARSVVERARLGESVPEWFLKFAIFAGVGFIGSIWGIHSFHDLPFGEKENFKNEYLSRGWLGKTKLYLTILFQGKC